MRTQMKKVAKKIALLAGVLLLSVVGPGWNWSEVQAQEPDGEEITDLSYLMTEDAIVGHMTVQTKGVYLSDGCSVIREDGVGKIAAGGTTNAARLCRVSVNVIVERLVDGKWSRVTSWSAIRENELSVTSAKQLSVGRGYYYRVRCLHSAASDTGSSVTGGLWV